MDNTQLVIKDVNLREKKIAEFTKACDKLETSLKRDTWAVAEVVHKTVTASNFNDAFANLQDYADCINYGKSNLSKMSQSVKWAKVCESHGLPMDRKEYTVGQFTELLPVFKHLFIHDKEVTITDDSVNSFVNFYNDNEITAKMSTKDLRTAVKQYMAAIEDKAEKPEKDESESGESEDKPLNDTCVDDETDYDYIRIIKHDEGKENNVDFTVTNPKMIAAIKEYFNRLFEEYGNDVTLNN